GGARVGCAFYQDVGEGELELGRECGGGGHDSGHADHAQFLKGQLEHHLLLLWVMKLQWLTAFIRRLPVCQADRRRRRSLARPCPQWRAVVLLATARP